MPDVPAPDACPPRLMPPRFERSVFDHVETRVALGRTFADLDGAPGSPVTALWARLPSHLDPAAASIAIFGDLLAGGAASPLGRMTIGQSLDNTIRVATLEPTEWVLVDIHMHALVGGFAQGVAYLWSERGTLLGTASQSMSSRLWDASAS